MADASFVVTICNSTPPSRTTTLALPATKEQALAAFEAIGTTDYRIMDCECLCPNLIDRIDLKDRLDALNVLAYELQGLDAESQACFVAMVESGRFTTLPEIVDLSYNMDCFCLLPQVHTAEQLGQHKLERCGQIDIPKAWQAAVDPSKLGRIICTEEHGKFTPRGYLSRTVVEWEKCFDSAHIPVHLQIDPPKAPQRERKVRRNTPER